MQKYEEKQTNKIVKPGSQSQSDERWSERFSAMVVHLLTSGDRGSRAIASGGVVRWKLGPELIRPTVSPQQFDKSTVSQALFMQPGSGSSDTFEHLRSFIANGENDPAVYGQLINERSR